MFGIAEITLMGQIRSSNWFIPEELDDIKKEMPERIEVIPGEFLETENAVAKKA